MLRQIARAPDSCAQRSDILVGARSSKHLFALDEVRALAEKVPNASIHVAVEEEPAADYHAGRVTDLLAGLELDPSTRVYVCGPPGMVDACRQAAIDARIPRQEVLCERFA